MDYHYIYVIWENYRDWDNIRDKSIFKVTLDEDIAKQYCDKLNQKEKERNCTDYWKNEYYYSTHILTDSFQVDL